MEHAFPPTADGLHAPLRMAGRNSRGGARPPTGVKSPQYGDHRMQGTDLATCPRGGVYPARHEGHHPSHVTPEQGERAKRTGTSNRAGPGSSDRAWPSSDRQSLSKRRFPSGEAGPGAKASVSDSSVGRLQGQPALYTDPRSHQRNTAPTSHYQQPCTHIQPKTDPANSGKMLVWERFRDYAGDPSLSHVPQTRTLSSVQETTQDEMSDGGSTTSGSYVLDTDDFRQRPLTVCSKDSFV